MSQGDNVVINPLERALSEDINNLQSVERSRTLGARQAGSRAVPSIFGMSGSGVTDVYFDVPALTVPGVMSGVLQGLQPALPNPLGATTLTMQPGSVVYFDTAPSGNAPYDSNSYRVGTLKEPLTGVTPGATYGGTPIPPAGSAAWLLVARPVNATTVTTVREVFDPGTQQFVPQNVPKLQEGEIEFQFIDLDGGPIPYPGDEWQLIAVCGSINGVFAIPLMDIRQMVSPGQVGISQDVDLESINWHGGAQQLHNVEYKVNGRRHYFAAPNIQGGTYLEPGAGPILADEIFSIWAFMCRRPDGSAWRPPALALTPNAGANILISRQFPTSRANGSPLALPSIYEIWSNWILGWGGGEEVPPAYALNLGGITTRETSAEFQRIHKSGRSIVNASNDRYANPLINIDHSNVFSAQGFVGLTGAPGYASDTTGIILPTFTWMTYGVQAPMIKWRVTFNNIVGSTRFVDQAAAQRAVLWLKTTNAAPNDGNVILASPVPSTGATIAPADEEVIVPDFTTEFWWPADQLGRVYIDIRNGQGNNDLVADGAGFNVTFNLMEWRF
jgi:hypothetical protein